MTACLVLVSKADDAFIPAIAASHLKECLRCRDWVRPVLNSTRKLSSKSNLPGMFGIFKNIACCPQCGEKI